MGYNRRTSRALHSNQCLLRNGCRTCLLRLRRPILSSSLLPGHRRRRECPQQQSCHISTTFPPPRPCEELCKCRKRITPPCRRDCEAEPSSIQHLTARVSVGGSV